jgi:hypothetical protein
MLSGTKIIIKLLKFGPKAQILLNKLLIYPLSLVWRISGLEELESSIVHAAC